MRKTLFLPFSITISFGLANTLVADDRILVKGLFAGSAVLEVNGTARLLKEGRTSPEGITLVQATSQFATIEHNGQTQKMVLNNDVGANYDATQSPSINLMRQADGHFIATGKVNDRWVEFMVDTGATNVTLNSFTAEQMGIDYSKGTPVELTTAQGSIKAFEVVLNSVAVGDVGLSNVSAFVIEGRFPRVVLLGNTFLSRVDMQVDNSTMTLQNKN